MRKTLAFILLFFVLDWTTHVALARLFRRTFQGEGGGLINCALAQEPQILILGSSRAKYHIMPAVIRTVTSRTAFNAGISGQDYLYSVMLFDLWKRSHPAPRAILLHVDPDSFARRPDEIGKAIVFSPFYDVNARVKEILRMRGRFEILKYGCRSYRFNGKVLPILKNTGRPLDPAFDGFVPLQGTLDASAGAAQDKPRSGAPPAPWDVKLRYFHEIADYCRQNDTRLYLVHSPRLGPEGPQATAWARSMQDLAVSTPGCEFIDISERTCPALFANKPNLFKDEDHLNAEGARLFSTLLAERLKSGMPAA